MRTHVLWYIQMLTTDHKYYPMLSCENLLVSHNKNTLKDSLQSESHDLAGLHEYRKYCKGKQI